MTRALLTAVAVLPALAAVMPAAAQQPVPAPPLGGEQIVSAVKDCLAAWDGGSPSLDALKARHWRTGKGVFADGTTASAVARDGDGATMTLSDSGCVLGNPLAADLTVDQLSTALTMTLLVEPRKFGRDSRWILPNGFVQVHVQQQQGTFMAVIVQIATVKPTP